MITDAEYQALKRAVLLRDTKTVEEGGLPINVAIDVQLSHIKPDVQFKLMIIGLHMATELIERLVVIHLFQMSKFMHHNHFKKLFRCVLKQCANEYLSTSFKFSAMNH